MDVGFVEFEEGTEGSEALFLLVQLEAYGLVVGQFGDYAKEVEDYVLAGGEHLD